MIEPIIDINGEFTSSYTITSGVTIQGDIRCMTIDGMTGTLQELYQKRHEPPRVIPPTPLTINQQCAAALSRLRVSLEANTEWQKSILHKQCAEYDMAERAQNARMDALSANDRFPLNYWWGVREGNALQYDVTWVNKVPLPLLDYLWVIICWGILAAVLGILIALL